MWRIQSTFSHADFPGITSIPAGGYLVLARTDLSDLFIDDAGGELALISSNGVPVDTVRYGPQAAGYSFNRTAGGWALGVPTPGAANSVVATAPLSSLRLNEWLADPAPGEDDWIELFNSNPSQPVVMTGLHAGANGTTFRIDAPAAVAPGGWTVWRCDSGSPRGDAWLFNLPAAGATVTLADQNGAVFDSIVFARQTPEVSEGRLPDGSGPITVAPISEPRTRQLRRAYRRPATQRNPRHQPKRRQRALGTAPRLD